MKTSHLKMKAFSSSIIVGMCVFCMALTSQGKTTEVDQAWMKEKALSLRIPFVANQGQVDMRVKYYAETFAGTVLVTDEGKIVYNLLSKEKAGQTISLSEKPLGARIKEIRGEQKAVTQVSYFRGNNPAHWKTGLSTYHLVAFGEIYPGIELKLKAHGNNVEKLFYVKPQGNPANIQMAIEEARKISTDREGNLVVSTKRGALKFSKPIAYQEIKGERREVAIAYCVKGRGYGFKMGHYDKIRDLVIDPALLYSTYLGGSSNDYGYDIAVDISGNIYVVGDTLSTNFPVTAGAKQTTNAGGRDIFISKINAAGTALVYSTYLGGSSDDYSNGIAIDSSGNAYVTGKTGSANFPATAGAYQTTNAGGTDIFISKLNATGTALVYSTYLGGALGDSGNAIAIDGSTNGYITGSSYSADFPVTAGAFQTAYAGSGDSFITKINAAGTALLYSTYLGGTLGDFGQGIAIDGSANAYVTGSTASTNFPVTAGAFKTANAASNDGFITKINASGTAPLLYSTYLGGTSDDFSYGIAIDSSGNAYVTGETDSADFPVTAGVCQTANAGGDDIFITKINASGTAPLLYSTYLGGSGSEAGYGIAIDSSGTARVTGSTASTNFPVTAGAYQTANAGGSDTFITKINASGTTPLLYSTYLGGTGNDAGYAIALDSSGNAYVTGETASANFPVTTGAVQGTNTGSTDAFAAKIRVNDSTKDEGSGGCFIATAAPGHDRAKGMTLFNRCFGQVLQRVFLIGQNFIFDF